MTAGVMETCLPPRATVAAQYEALRMAALGEALPLEARSGLMLFLCRGMWGWARTLAGQSVREEPTAAPSDGLTATCAREAVIDVLAALAIDTQKRRAL